MNPVKQLFKRNKPVIRSFEYPDFEEGKSGDLPILWDAYKRNELPDMPEGIEMDVFVEIAEEMRNQLFEVKVVEDLVGDAYEPVAFVFVKDASGDGWQIEPHVVYLDTANLRHKLRSYVAYLKKTKYRKDIGACVLRVDKETTKLANRAEKYGLLEYVGKIWGGRPDGNDYLYSVRCNRRH